MAIAFVTAANNNGAAVDNLSATISPANGNTLVVVVALNGTAQTVSTVQDNNNSTTFASANAVNNTNRVEVWSARNVTGSPTSVKVTLSASNLDWAMSVGEYSGVAVVGQNGTNSGNSADPTISLTTVDANNWVVAGFCTTTPAATSKTGNLRDATASPAVVADALNDNTVAAPSSVTNAITHALAVWAAVALELRTIYLAPVQQFMRSGGMIGRVIA